MGRRRASKDTLERVAHHEAGHAVVALVERIAFTQVTIVPGEEYLGEMRHRPLTADFFGAAACGVLPRHRLEGHVIVCFAGAEAEKAFAGRYNHQGAQQDRDSAATLLERAVGSEEEFNAWSRLLHIRARQRVKMSWPQIQAVATALLERKTLNARQVRQVLHDRHLAEGAALIERLGGIELLRRNVIRESPADGDA